jgi:hypothetical protein
MRSSLLAVGALSVSGLVGCGLPPSGDGPDAEPTSQSATAIVVIERSAGPGDAVRGDAVVARFVRVRPGAVDDAALRLAGVVQDLPAIGACASPSDGAWSRAADPAAAQAGRQIDLLDVGAVTLEGAPGRSTSLLARAMPDPAGVVSGVFYSARTKDDAFATGSRVQLRATGGEDLTDGFSVSVPSPHELGDVAVAPTAAGLDVTWDASEADPRDVVYVDVVDVNAASPIVARCTALDAGRLLVPASALGAIDEGELSVHRLHRESFHARGVDPGEVRFDLSRVSEFRR